MPVPARLKPILAGGLIVGAVLGGVALAQLEGGDRGVAPVDSSSNFEVTGVAVDVVGKDADQARTAAWREAQRRGWAMLWGHAHGQDPGNAPKLSDGTLDSIVAGIEVEEEHVGPTRYLAKLGILFDRSRSAGLLGVRGVSQQSPPTLVIPVEWDGGTPISFEERSDWQKAWARFRPGGSPIDYVRPVGTGLDPLLLTVGQAERPGRTWWRMILDQYSASDVVIPVVHLDRLWPGGPVVGRFEARHGADNTLIESFTLRADGDQLDAMLDEGVRRIDAAYTTALNDGRLTVDASLQPPAAPAQASDNASGEDEPVADTDSAAPPAAGGIAATLQVDTADAAALGRVSDALRSVPSLSDVQVESLALGGTSVLRARFDGDVDLLRAALTARGWQLEGAGPVFRLRRATPQTPPPEVTGGAPPR